MWSNMSENGNWETYSNQAREREKVGTVGSAEKIAVRLDDEGNLREKNRKVKKKYLKDKFTNATFQSSSIFHNSWWSNMMTSGTYSVKSKNRHQLKHTKVKSISHLMSQGSIVLWNSGVCRFCHVHGRVQVLLTKTGGALFFGLFARAHRTSCKQNEQVTLWFIISAERFSFANHVSIHVWCWGVKVQCE